MGRVLCALRPAYLLVLRVILAYVMFAPDKVPLSSLQAQAHVLAPRGIRGGREESSSGDVERFFLAFCRGRVVAAITPVLDSVWPNLLVPRATFQWGPVQDKVALRACY